MSTETSRSGYDAMKGAVDDVLCGTLMLGAPSLLALILIGLLVSVGVSPVTIEKGMVLLSVPWFAGCYFLCKWSRDIKVIAVIPPKDPLPEPLYRRRVTNRK